MSDPGHAETDAILERIERQITREYRQAEEELERKLDDYLKRFETKDKIWQQWVKDGKKTQKQYQEWKKGQMAIGRQWNSQKKMIADEMAYTNQIARNIVSKMMPGVYAINHNYGTYEVEHETGIDTHYGLYDKDTVENLFLNEKLYHDPGRTTLGRLAQGKEKRWNKQIIQSEMLQGILQGESISNMASRIVGAVGEKNRKAAIRNARTITTGVENKGRVDSYKRANKMGIETRQQWVATLDGRTRHSHRLLDGEAVDPGQKFSNGCRYPGDPDGPASEIYNCRCTLIAAIKGFERDMSDLSIRNTNKLQGMSYEEWKKAKPKSQDIMHQEKTAEAMKNAYVGEYKGKRETDFYTGPNGISLPAIYKGWMGESKRDEYMSAGTNKRYLAAIDELYRPGSFIGDGGVADALRFEKETGLSVGSKPNMSHLQKAQERVRYIENKVLKENLSETERKIISSVCNDLKKSIESYLKP